MKVPFSLDIKLILIIILIFIIVFQRCTSENNKKDTEIIKIGKTDYELLSEKIDTVYLEKQIEVLKYMPKYIVKVDTIKVNIPAYVDTLKILEKYFSTYKVIDTLELVYDFSKEYADADGKIPNPNIGYGVVTDEISKNTIIGRSIVWNYKIPYIKDTKIVKDLPKNQLYIGINTNFTKQSLVNSVGVGTLLKTKNDKIYQLNTGFTDNFNGNTQLYIGGGLYWKIKLKN